MTPGWRDFSPPCRASPCSSAAAVNSRSGVFVSGGKIYYRVRHLERVLFETRDVSLRGDFNLEDVLAATTAACLLGADFAAIRKAVREFKAVEHRLEFVREIQGVDFYNNSKATSVDATLKSLEAFERGVHLIMGGKDKGAPYTPLLPLIKERVREVLLIGAAAPMIAQQLAGSDGTGSSGRSCHRRLRGLCPVAPRRYGAAGAGLFELRSVHGLRRARPGVQRTG